MSGIIGHRGLLLGASLHTEIMADISVYGGYYWPLGEPSGTVMVNDGPGADGIYTGTVTHGRPALYSGGGSSTLLGAGGAGYGDSVILANAGPALSSMSVGCVVKMNSVSGFRPFICLDDSLGQRSFSLLSDGANVSFFKATGGTGLHPTSGSPLSTGAPLVVIATYSATGTLEIYVNGVNYLTTAPGAVTFSGVSIPFDIGRSIVFGSFLDGDMSDAFVIAGELSSARIAAYQAATGI